jgi:hypothetical protein
LFLPFCLVLAEGQREQIKLSAYKNANPNKPDEDIRIRALLSHSSTGFPVDYADICIPMPL